jgi:hypothetical protein
VGVARCRSRPPGEVQRVDLRLIETGILGVLALDGLDDLGRLRPGADLGVEKRLHGGVEFIGKRTGWRPWRPEVRRGANACDQPFLLQNGVGPDSGCWTSRQILKDR